MLQKIKNLPYFQKVSDLVARFSNVQAVGLLVFLSIALMVTWSGAKVIQRNYELQKQISQLRQENQVRELENNNLELQNQYFNTDQYLELKARQDFGKGQSGEKLLLVPRDVALSYATADIKKPVVVSPASQRPAYQRNFESWVDFFLHRQDSM